MNNTNNQLTVYLAGAMEAADNLGSGWRNKLTPFLRNDLRLKVLNPCEFEPEQLVGLQPNRLPEYFTDLFGQQIKPKHWHELKNASEPHLYKRFLKYMRRIIHYDIKIVETQTDYVICYWNEQTGRGAGTHSELTSAFLKNIPVFCVATCTMPAWAKACCTEIFLDFNNLKKFLREEFDFESSNNCNSNGE